jgi:hypothetical protein
MFIPDPDLDFYPSLILDRGIKKTPDPGIKKAPDPGSGSATLIFHICYTSKKESSSSRKSLKLFRENTKFFRKCE